MLSAQHCTPVNHKFRTMLHNPLQIVHPLCTTRGRANYANELRRQTMQMSLNDFFQCNNRSIQRAKSHVSEFELFLALSPRSKKENYANELDNKLCKWTSRTRNCMHKNERKPKYPKGSNSNYEEVSTLIHCCRNHGQEKKGDFGNNNNCREEGS